MEFIRREEAVVAPTDPPAALIPRDQSSAIVKLRALKDKVFEPSETTTMNLLKLLKVASSASVTIVNVR
jgi:hypothetical protein